MPSESSPFPGFEPLTANYIYCPNQFLEVCLPNCSRGTVRLVGYLLRRTLGWLDQHGQPIEQEISVSFRELISQAGISRGAIRAAIEEALAAKFMSVVQQGRAKQAEDPGQTAQYSLRWGSATCYEKDMEKFDGFFLGDGHRTPIPNAFFDRVLPTEPLSMIKVVGTILRHTVGYRNQFGGEHRSSVQMSYSQIQNFCRLQDRSTLSSATHRTINCG